MSSPIDDKTRYKMYANVSGRDVLVRSDYADISKVKEIFISRTESTPFIAKTE